MPNMTVDLPRIIHDTNKKELENRCREKIVSSAGRRQQLKMALPFSELVEKLYPSQLGFAMFILDGECKYSLISEPYGYDSTASPQDRRIC